MSFKTYDYGDLRVTLTNQLEWLYDDAGSGVGTSAGFYQPRPQGNMCALGSIGHPSHEIIDRKRAVLLVGPNPNTSPSMPAVKRPTGYTEIWNDRGSGGKHDGSVWRPIAPSGYSSCGDVVNGSYSAPSTDRIWCLRNDLVKPAAYQAAQFWDRFGLAPGGRLNRMMFVNVVANPVGFNGSEKIPLSAGTFRAYREINTDTRNEIAFVPLLTVKNNFQPFGTIAPSITPSTIPSQGEQFQSKEQCRVLLPFTAFFPATHQRSLELIQDPFISISRSIAWYVEGVWVNNGSGPFNREKVMKCGISKTQSQEMSHSVGVEISATAGIGCIESSIKLNYQFTSTTSSSFTEYKEQEVTEKFEVPAKHATVLFSKHVKITASRGSVPQYAEILGEVEMTANDDVHFSGCAL
ncbi:f17e9c1e-9e17-452f-9682-3d312176324e [Sclerotinia trifoliorum]|uniref:F17e9c1e-9e17-452f-9682-3d312176324e n=1 Tax=Sclerotinia trifoliorum TaxID=28548 RepID=A0A8H2VQP6_9HELO|nr:f17e9c1e-9e17-452f-9682-3d312176324e [Sclerotinia trifoliorum]